MKDETWDYQIDGKEGMVGRMIFLAIPAGIFTVLAIDQLQPGPNKYLPVAFGFGSIAAVSLVLFLRLLVRYLWFRVDLGKRGFYLQTNPLDGKYYEYGGIQSCWTESKSSLPRHGSRFSAEYFVFVDESGKIHRFQFESAFCQREIRALKKRIEKQKRKGKD